MSVNNGNLANETTFNTSFMSREVNTSTVGQVDLENADAPSGASLANIQRIINSIASALGMSTAEVYNFIYDWPNDYVGTVGDTVLVRINALIARFNGTTGHVHDGTNGEGALISAMDLDNINKFFSQWKVTTFSGVTGGSNVVNSAMLGLNPGGDVSALGVVTTAPFNKCAIIDSDTGTPIEDGSGNKVYGRMTFGSGNWTLTYYIFDAGIESTYSIPGTYDVQIFFREVFDLTSRPTFPDGPEFGSADISADIPDATASQRGLVSTGTQTFGGAKTFNGDVTALSGVVLDSVADNAATGSNATATLGAKAIIRFTNASLTSLDTLSGGVANQIVFLMNRTGADVTITNNAGADGFLTGTGADFTFQNNATAMCVKDTGSRWTIIGGGGAGGGVAYQEQPTGTVNGVNDTFGPLTFLPSDDNSILVTVDGVVRRLTTDYTVSGSDIVFNSGKEPQNGQDVYVYYLTSGFPSVPVMSGTFRVEYRTITGGEATAKALTLAFTPSNSSYVMLDLIGGGAQEFGVDYTVSGTTFDWDGYALDGILTAGDKLRLAYVT